MASAFPAAVATAVAAAAGGMEVPDAVREWLLGPAGLAARARVRPLIVPVVRRRLQTRSRKRMHAHAHLTPEYTSECNLLY